MDAARPLPKPPATTTKSKEQLRKVDAACSNAEPKYPGSPPPFGQPSPSNGLGSPDALRTPFTMTVRRPGAMGVLAQGRRKRATWQRALTASSCDPRGRSCRPQIVSTGGCRGRAPGCRLRPDEHPGYLTGYPRSRVSVAANRGASQAAGHGFSVSAARRREGPGPRFCARLSKRTGGCPRRPRRRLPSRADVRRALTRHARHGSTILSSICPMSDFEATTTFAGALTDAELRVLPLLTTKLSLNQIAEALGVPQRRGGGAGAGDLREAWPVRRGRLAPPSRRLNRAPQDPRRRSARPSTHPQPGL